MSFRRKPEFGFSEDFRTRALVSNRLVITARLSIQVISLDARTVAGVRMTVVTTRHGPHGHGGPSEWRFCCVLQEVYQICQMDCKTYR
jgi:hypothetical protein